ncbi:MAG: hypothetical protein ACREPK_07530, partial [Rhodanobacteraceae bacterium]
MRPGGDGQESVQLQAVAGLEPDRTAFGHLGGLDPGFDFKQFGGLAGIDVEQVVRARITVTGNEEQQLAAVLAEVDEVDEFTGKAFFQLLIKLRSRQVGIDEDSFGNATVRDGCERLARCRRPLQIADARKAVPGKNLATAAVLVFLDQILRTTILAPPC